MPTYVIKSWKVLDTPLGGDQTSVEISGRAAGFIPWLMSLMKISPTVSLTVRANKICFEEGSLEGHLSYITPLENICATYYGYIKPLKQAVFLAVVLGGLTFFLAGLPGIIIGVIYYFLNRSLTIGFTDIGGRDSSITFKRSVIEGHNIDEISAARACSIIQELVDRRREMVMTGGVALA